MQHLVYDSVEVYSQIRDECLNVLGKAKEADPRYSSFCGMMLHYYSARCQSINILLQEWKLWDCDIIMRSALECASRLLYVSIAPSEERSQRIDEYSIFLSEIEDLQRSEKAKTVVAESMNGDISMLVGGAVLDADEEHRIREKWPKAKRKALKQRWSFSEIANTLSTFHDDGLDLRSYKSLLHGYGLSSHLIHADQTAMDVVWDRSERTPQERELLENAHFARLAIEPTLLLSICWRAISYAIGQIAEHKEITQRIISLSESADVHHRAFAESQSHLYPQSRSSEA